MREKERVGHKEIKGKRKSYIEGKKEREGGHREIILRERKRDWKRDKWETDNRGGEREREGKKRERDRLRKKREREID